MEFKDTWISFIHQLQNDICSTLEAADGKALFREDKWQREEGGGGVTRVIENGNVFEKGGVNSSIVFGKVTDAMRTQLKVDGHSWFACGLSIVLHPVNPFVPTVHLNYRMFELYDESETLIDRWFGGGTDLTPYYIIEKDCVHFHKVLKETCDLYDEAFYPAFKKNCDNYFLNTHRSNERRGIGGIFYDYQKEAGNKDLNFWLGLSKSLGYAFLDAYLPVVARNKYHDYTASQKKWQEIRRGRYVEFNLVHDRGTIFGLKTNGRIESILMSLPPTVRFEYDHKPAPGSEEEKLLQICLEPVNWV
jgi:coproporphyrinogen III oxidase